MSGDLASKVGDILEREMPGIGRAMFRKQCEELGIDPDSVAPRDLPQLAGRLSWMAKTVAGPEKASRVYSDISALIDMDKLAAQEAGGEQLEMLGNLAKAGIYAGDWKRAGGYLDTLIERARDSGDHRALSESLMWKGVMYKEMARYDDAIVVLTQAFEEAMQSGDSDLVARCHCRIGDVRWYAGELDKALGSYQAAAEKARDGKDVAAAHIGLAIIYGIWQQFDKAIPEYREALKHLEGTGDSQGIARAYNNLGDAYLQMGKWDDALDALTRGEEYGEKGGWANIKAYILMNSAVALVHKGVFNTAREKLNDAQKITETIGSKAALAGVHHAFGLLHRTEKGWSRMEESYRRSMMIYTEIKVPYYAALCRLELGQGFMDAGQPKKALVEFREAKAIYQQIGVERLAADAQREIERAESALKSG